MSAEDRQDKVSEHDQALQSAQLELADRPDFSRRGEISGLSLMSRVDEYLASLLGHDDPVLDTVEDWLKKSPHPPIAISRPMGRLLSLLIKLRGAKRVVEIGTLFGISGIWLARGLPTDGKLVTIEKGIASATVAKKSFDLAGLQDRIDVIVGDACSVLRSYNQAPFDAAFIDGDKSEYPDYLEALLPHMGAGSLLIADNVLLKGKPLHASPNDRTAQGLAQFNRRLMQDSRFEATIIPTSECGLADGFAICLVR